MRKIIEKWSAGKPVMALLALAIFIGVGASTANAQAFTEDFAVVPVPGWTTQNNSTIVGTTTWFQGNTAVFPAQAGAANSYIGANFNATTGTNTISTWLVSPNRTFNNGDIIKFWTRTSSGALYPDRLQVRLSTAGTSTNVGTGPTGIGDFTTLLQDINPTYTLGGYPEVWTQYTITLSGLSGPTSGRVAFRYFVEDGGPTGANSNFIGIDSFEYILGGPVVPVDAPVDLNGDGRTDYVVVRNVGGGAAGQVRWFYNLNNSANPTVAFDWGLASDFFVSEDFDGDDKDDITVWRPSNGTFYIYNSATNTVRVEQFGQTGDDPTVVDDYNGDGKADLAVYRAGAAAGQQSTWFYRTVAGGATNYVPWGQNGDFPVPGDFDGDLKADFVVQRADSGSGRFWRRFATGTTDSVVFGLSSDVVVPGDYDGDGKTDIATARGISGALTWFVRPSSGATAYQVTFGASATDRPTQGDYDGDGKTDVAIWRGTAFWSRSTATGAVTTFALGAAGDYPVANYNAH